MSRAKHNILRLTLLSFFSAGMLLSCQNGNSKPEEEKPEKVKVGILFSISGNMSYSEASLKDAVLMAVEEINDDGGILGKKIEVAAEDPGSETDAYRKLAARLFRKEQVSVIFGCRTSEARKAVLPLTEKEHKLLFYPAAYEGEEQAENIVYLGATPNQQIKPALSYLLDSSAIRYNKFYLIGQEGIFSRESNKFIKEVLQQANIPASNIVEKSTSIGQDNFEKEVREIKFFCTKGKVVILSTITGNANLDFYKELANQGLSSAICPVMAFSVSEDEFRHMETEFITGHLSTKNYFQLVDSDKNLRFVSSFKLFCAINELPGGIDRVTSDEISWAYTGVHLWKKAVEKAGTFDTEEVKKALLGMEYNSPAGMVRMDSSHLQLAKPVFIAESQSDGLFEVIWKSDSLAPPLVYREYSLAEEQKKTEMKGG